MSNGRSIDEFVRHEMAETRLTIQELAGVDTDLSVMLDNGAESDDIMKIYMLIRDMIALGKTAFEKKLKELDDSIKIFMVAGGYEKFEHDGFRMKISNGVNSRISRDLCIEYLTTVEWNPDQVKAFLEAVTVDKPYDYIDVRKTSKEK